MDTEFDNNIMIQLTNGKLYLTAHEARELSEKLRIHLLSINHVSKNDY